jgi:hypothetical protein
MPDDILSKGKNPISIVILKAHNELVEFPLAVCKVQASANLKIKKYILIGNLMK